MNNKGKNEFLNVANDGYQDSDEKSFDEAKHWTMFVAIIMFISMVLDALLFWGLSYVTNNFGNQMNGRIENIKQQNNINIPASDLNNDDVIDSIDSNITPNRRQRINQLIKSNKYEVIIRKKS